MSFILDALKKSATDRQRQVSPALFEVKVAAPRRKVPVWALALGALLLVNMAVLAWVLLRRPDSPAAPVAATSAPAASTSTPAPANGVQPGMVTVQIPVGSSVTVGPNNPAGVEPSAVGAPPLADEPLLESQAPAVPPDYDARDYRPAITPEQAGAIAAARRSGALPSRDEVLAQGNQLPDLRLDLHVYDPDPASRFVFLNMRKLREGETLPEGVRVDQITQTGVELTYRGRRFTLEGN